MKKIIFISATILMASCSSNEIKIDDVVEAVPECHLWYDYIAPVAVSTFLTVGGTGIGLAAAEGTGTHIGAGILLGTGMITGGIFSYIFPSWLMVDRDPSECGPADAPMLIESGDTVVSSEDE